MEKKIFGETVFNFSFFSIVPLNFFLRCLRKPFSRKFRCWEKFANSIFQIFPIVLILLKICLPMKNLTEISHFYHIYDLCIRAETTVLDHPESVKETNEVFSFLLRPDWEYFEVNLRLLSFLNHFSSNSQRTTLPDLPGVANRWWNLAQPQWAWC